MSWSKLFSCAFFEIAWSDCLLQLIEMQRGQEIRKEIECSLVVILNTNFLLRIIVQISRNMLRTIKNLRISCDFIGSKFRNFSGNACPLPPGMYTFGEWCTVNPFHHWVTIVPYPQLYFAGSFFVGDIGKL